MKKYLALLLASLMLLGCLAACSSEKSTTTPPSGTAQDAPQTTVKEESTPADTAEPVETADELEGEITGYDFAPMAVKEDAIASQTRLTITVRVRYSNRVNPDEDFEQSFSAYREFDSNLMPQQVEGTLCEEIIEEIVDQIYNATVANW